MPIRSGGEEPSEEDRGCVARRLLVDSSKRLPGRTQAAAFAAQDSDSSEKLVGRTCRSFGEMPGRKPATAAEATGLISEVCGLALDRCTTKKSGNRRMALSAVESSITN